MSNRIWITSAVIGLAVLGTAGWIVAGGVYGEAIEASQLEAEPLIALEAASTELSDGSTLTLEVDDPVAVTGGYRLDAVFGLSAVPATEEAVVFTIDVSGSTTDAQGDGCGGSYNNDGLVDTILDCELASVGEVLPRLRGVGEAGAIIFHEAAVATDVSPVSGFQSLTAPTADLDSDGVYDIEQVLKTARGYQFFFTRSIGVTYFTRIRQVTGNYSAFDRAITRSCDVLAGATAPRRSVVFLSDGEAIVGKHVSDVLPCADSSIRFHTVAVGEDQTCAGDYNGKGSLQDMADLTGGSCVEVTDPSELATSLGELLLPTIDKVTLTVDGGEEVDITASVVEDMPHTGDGKLHLSHVAPAGDHELCVTVYATGGGEGSLTQCVVTQQNAAPIADAGTDVEVTEGALVTLDGTGSSDPDADPLTYVWSIAAESGPPLVVPSASLPGVAFRTLDDGEYVATLTVSDGELTDSDTVRVSVKNSKPTLSTHLDGAPVRGVALLTGSFADDGVLDTHTASIDWGDGTRESALIPAQGTGWGNVFGSHAYAKAGTYTVAITVTDDDGDTVTVSHASQEVGQPIAVWAEGSAGGGITWTGGSGDIKGLVHSNGDLKITGAKKTVEGAVEYVGSSKVTGGASVTPAPVKTTASGSPVSYDIADYRPTGRAALHAGADYHDMSSSCSGGTYKPKTALDPGIYYADCDVHLTSSALKGAVTIVSEKTIQVSGSSAAFDPFVDGLLFLSGSTSSKAIQISAAKSQLLGFLYAKSGGVDLSGSGNRYLCGVVGDDVDLGSSGLDVLAADCVRPDRTTAPPTLMPQLSLDLALAESDVLPGVANATGLTLTHDGAVLVVPGVIGLENLGTDTVTLTSGEVVVEVFDPDAEIWDTLDAPTTLTAVANADSKTTYPDDDEDPFTDTELAPGALATWGVAVTIRLDTDAVEALLDEDKTGAIRTRVAFTQDDTTVPVRRLYRFGDDFVDALRDAGADVEDVELTASTVDGAVKVLTSADASGLGRVEPGDVIAISLAANAPKPADKAASESVPAYLARLHGLDGSGLGAIGWARGDASVGPVLTAQQLDRATLHVAVLDPTFTAPEDAIAGDSVDLTLELANTSTADVPAITADARFESSELGFDFLAAGLASGVSGSDTTSLTPDTAYGGQDIRPSASVAWTDDAGNGFGPVVLTTSVRIERPGEVVAELVDALYVDADANGVIGDGDTIRYTATLSNPGTAAVADLKLVLPLDANTSLVAGSAVTSQGTVSTTTDEVTANLGTLAGMDAITVRFDARIDDPLPASATSLSVQGLLTSATDSAVTDDPSVEGSRDPTVTPILRSEPELRAWLVDSVLVDADLNGGPSKGDTLRYTANVFNMGLASADGVAFSLTPDSGTELVVGSVTGDGTVASGHRVGDSTVTVDLGSVTHHAFQTVSFDVTITTDAAAATLSAQATLTATGLSAVLSDDPDTITERDATLTQLGSGSGSGGTDDSGLPVEGDDLGIGPSVAITAPGDGARVGSPVTVTTSVALHDADIASWKLLIWPATLHPSAAVELASGTGAVPADAALLDPTLLENGLYRLRLQAVDEDGYVGRDTIAVTVEGGMKLGSYDVAFLDAEWQSSMFTGRMVRAYSTLRKDLVGDFGHGWRLSRTDVQVMTNGPLGLGGWTQAGCGDGFVFVPVCTESDTPHLVVVKWPGGAVEAFDLVPGEGSSFFSALAPIEYVARTGTGSTLKPVLADSAATAGGDGNLYSGFGRAIYDPQQFLLTDPNGVVYLLDRNKGLLKTTDPNGNSVVYTEGGIFPDHGVGVEFVRDSEGRITKMDLPRGEIVYRYDTAGDLVEVEDQEGAVTEFVYDTDHRLKSYNDDGKAALATITYDSDGRVIREEDAEGVFVKRSQDTLAWTETVVGPDARLTTVAQYDADGQLVQVDRTVGSVTRTVTLAYTDYRVTEVTGPGSAVNTFDYDDQGRLIEHVDADGIKAEVTYTSLGKVEKRYLNGRLISRTVYDEHGNPTQQRGPADELYKTSTYNSWGAPESYTDADGIGATLLYDTKGQIRGIERDSGDTISFKLADDGELIAFDNGSTVPRVELNDRGQMTAFVDDNYHTQKWEFDPDTGNLNGIVDKLGKKNVFAYDKANRLEKETTRLAEDIEYTYDSAGRIERVEGPDAWVEYTYDGFGQVLTIENESALIELDWDARGFLEKVTTSGTTTGGMGAVALSYDYADSGRFEKMTSPWGTVELTYDGDGAPEKLIDSKVGTWTYAWEDDGTLESVTAPSGMKTAYSYTDALRLEEIRAVDGSGTTLQTLTLAYDDNGKVSTSTDATGTASFDYDADGRLESVIRPTGSKLSNETYTFDDLGNRTSWAGNSKPAVSHDAGDRLIADAVFTYAYDAEGRLKSKTEKSTGDVTSYRWNSFDELLAVVHPDGTETSFLYDGLGRRFEVDDRGEITRYVYDGLAPLAVLDDTDSLVTWQTTDPWGDLLAEHEPGVGTRDLLHDHLGTRTGWLEGGSVTPDPRDSFGNPVYDDDGVQHQALTWHSQDPTGLMYMYARYMDPRTGRFISEDPVISADMYSYAVNDPVNVWDPFGAAAAIEYDLNATRSSETTKGGATPIGCRIKCMLVTTAEGLAFSTDFGVFDAASLTVDWLQCAFSANPGFCFPAGTTIRTATGNVSIEQIEVDDAILAMEGEGGEWTPVGPLRPLVEQSDARFEGGEVKDGE